MALSAMEIYKLLPQTNCGDCGFPTCLAFAMQLANKQVSLDDCPHVSEEAKQELASASAPPIQLVKVGSGEQEIELGKETVMYRHEESFHNQPGLGALVSDELDDEELQEKFSYFKKFSYERIGEQIAFELVGIRNDSGDPGRFAEVVGLLLENTGQIPVLISEDPEAVKKAFADNSDLADRRPLIYAATADNREKMAELAAGNDAALAVRGEGLEELAELTPDIKEAGVENILLNPGTDEPLETLQEMTQIRRQALKNNFRPLGYPTVSLVEGDDPQELLIDAATYTCKYNDIVLIENAKAWQALPLTVLRQNIYTDPRVPPTVEAQAFEVGEELDENAPVLLTTNFALTYFTVASEVESSRVPSYILTVDTEGQSVLTAYSSENLNAEIAAKALKESGLEDKLNHKEVIIPGYIAVMSGSLEVESGWDVVVGPREATGIAAFLRDYTPGEGQKK